MKFIFLIENLEFFPFSQLLNKATKVQLILNE
jgi:hypothetical protein